MKTLFDAMAKAFAQIEGAAKDRNNPAFKAKYADLSSVVDAVKPALIANGLFFSQATHDAQGGVCIETIVRHSSGEEVSFGKLFVPATKQDAQGYGSALTYARRYSLMTALGVCPEDDDGNAASKANPSGPAPSAVQRISADQFGELTRLAEDTGTDARQFCAYYKISAVADLPADRFDHARAMLIKKLPADRKAA